MPQHQPLPFQRDQLPVDLGERLGTARKKAGLSRRDAATAAGIAANTIARIERNAQRPTWETLDGICGALGVSTYDIAPRWTWDHDDRPVNSAITPGVGLRAVRRREGVTLMQLAKAAGVSASSISRFERGLVASRHMARREYQSSTPFKYRDLVIDNDRVARALGYESSAALREACLGTWVE